MGQSKYRKEASVERMRIEQIAQLGIDNVKLLLDREYELHGLSRHLRRLFNIHNAMLDNRRYV